jgi:hypothetical protein
MIPRKYLLVAIVGLFALASPATATPWWVSYEGNDYPENEGWPHYVEAGGAIRTLEGGSLVVDSMSSRDIVDGYHRGLPSFPGPGETFRAEWRLRVDAVSGWCDPGVAVNFDDHGFIGFLYAYGNIFSEGESEWIASFQGGVFHDYVVTTSDLETYSLYIDGQLAHTGLIPWAGPDSWIEWGDVGSGSASHATWDYLRLGCVPEPTTGALFGLSVLAGLALSTRRVGRK